MFNFQSVILGIFILNTILYPLLFLGGILLYYFNNDYRVFALKLIETNNFLLAFCSFLTYLVFLLDYIIVLYYYYYPDETVYYDIRITGNPIYLYINIILSLFTQIYWLKYFRINFWITSIFFLWITFMAIGSIKGIISEYQLADSLNRNENTFSFNFFIGIILYFILFVTFYKLFTNNSIKITSN